MRKTGARGSRRGKQAVIPVGPGLGSRRTARSGLHSASSPSNTIVDEFSNLAISRQRRYQLRKERDKRCTLCGRPAENGMRCLEHLVRDREQMRRRAGYHRRNQNSPTARLEKARQESTPA